MNQKKTTIIFGGVVLAAGALWYIRHKQKQEAEAQQPSGLESAIVAPSTHYAIPYEGGGGGGFIGGGAGSLESVGGGPPSAPTPGVTTTPEPEHTNVTACGPDEKAVGVSAIKGQPGGIRCVKVNRNEAAQLLAKCKVVNGRLLCQ